MKYFLYLLFGIIFLSSVAFAAQSGLQASVEVLGEGGWINPESASRYLRTTCNEKNILQEDENSAGLAKKWYDLKTFIDETSVSSCIKVDFGSVQDITGIRAKVKAVESVCGDGCRRSGCGTGGDVKLFYSLDASNWNYVGKIFRTETLEWAEFNVQDEARYALICRGAWGSGRDNNLVDAIQIKVQAQEPECVEDKDCDDDYYSENYCYDKDVYYDLHDFFCGNSECQENIFNELVEDCGEDSCGNWENYCEDDDVYGVRNCFDRGCSDGDCFAEKTTEDELVEDCGEDEYSGTYCSNGDVYEDFTERGCGLGECFENANSELVEECDDGCENGECKQESMCTDSDGGLNYSEKGTVLFDGKSYTDYCFLRTKYLIEFYCLGYQVKRCSKGCSNGACR